MPKFNREKREKVVKWWMLANSLQCPKCKGRVYGDLEYTWCRTYDCNWFGLWENNCNLHNEKQGWLHSRDYRATVRQWGDNVTIFWEDDKENKYEPVLMEIDVRRKR